MHHDLPITPEMENNSERDISKKLHDLRTPLNQIVGFSEMLLEIAGEENHRDLLEGLAQIRDAGFELTHLLQNKDCISVEEQPGCEYWPLSDAVRAASTKIIGFTDAFLTEMDAPHLAGYRDDLGKILNAANNFIDLANSSNLLIHLESNRYWDNPDTSFLQTPATGSPTSAVGSNAKILIVDDESLNREVLSRRLQREGYLPTGVGSGREALDILHRDSFDAVLLDILMPEMSGMDVLQRLKSDPLLQHLPVIMLSAIADVDRVARCIEMGAEDYLPKPVNAVLLRARLGACLEKKRLRDKEQAHFQDMHAQKERLSVTLRSLADAVVTTDPEGKIVLLNEAGAKLTGIESHLATGRRFDEVFRIFHRNTGEPSENIVTQSLEKNMVVDSAPGVALMPPDGMERLVSLRSSPIHDYDGEIRGTVVVVRDITEREKMAEEVLRTSKLQSIGVLAGGIAHDFNNMLTAVTGNLSLIRQLRGMPPEVLSSIREAEHGALRAQELTRYLLTFAEGGAPMKQVLQLRALIQETSAFVVRGSNVNCEFLLPRDLWETEADPNQLAQVISNIVLNAVEATPNGGRIVIRAENLTAPLASVPTLVAGDYLAIIVEDRGTGIAPEHLSRIYDPFFTTKKQARGLGLAAAYSIIQRHGGHIAVESQPGAGTIVTFYLRALRTVVAPRRISPMPVDDDAGIETPLVPKPGHRKPLVLIMDDDDAIRLLAKIMFMRLDYDVVTTADGEAALSAHADAAAAGKPFDLVVMDLTIPGGMGGKEAIRRLREKDTTVKTIVSSGYSNDPVMADYASYGFDGVLPKPYTMDNLSSVLKELKAAKSQPNQVG